MGRRGVIGAAVVAVSAVGAWSGWSHRRTDWGSSWVTPPLLVLVLVSVWLLVVATFVVARWRPRSRVFVALVVLAVSWSLFVMVAMTPLDDGGLLSPGLFLRPSLFFLLLAWPSGYLAAADRTWWAVYSTLQAVLLWVVPQLFEPALGRRFVVVDLAPLPAICHAFALAIVYPVGAVVLYVSVRRRAGLLPQRGRRLLSPIVGAAAVTMVSELVLSVWVTFGEPGFDDGGRPYALGAAFLFVNYLPYGVTAVLVVVAVRRARAGSDVATSIEIGATDDVLRRAVIDATAPGAEVRFAGPGNSWLDGDGRRVAPPSGSTAVVEIRRADLVVATVATSESLTPDDIERAVAVAGATVDFARLAASANANRREAVAARQAITAARAKALSRLERDLHDGVQQRLVGLALQASMARRVQGHDDHVAHELRDGLSVARGELADAASGVLPALVGTRGLAASIANLAACASLDVEVHVEVPSDVPPEIAAAAWFVAAESVTNAAKHAGATRLRIRGAIAHAHDGLPCLDIMIDDDGGGGADIAGSGLVGLRSRVEAVGGELQVSSPLGAGTTVQASFPLAASNGAVP